MAVGRQSEPFPWSVNEEAEGTTILGAFLLFSQGKEKRMIHLNSSVGAQRA